MDSGANHGRFDAKWRGVVTAPDGRRALNQRKQPKKTVAGQPGFMTMMGRALTKGCPVCAKRQQFSRWMTMDEDCERCGLHFERIEGHWIGAIGMNTIVSFGILALFMIGGWVLTFPDFPLSVLIVSVVVSILVPVVFYPFSKTTWTAIDIAMRPLEAHEVNWAALDSSKNPPSESTSNDV